MTTSRRWNMSEITHIWREIIMMNSRGPWDVAGTTGSGYLWSCQIPRRWYWHWDWRDEYNDNNSDNDDQNIYESILEITLTFDGNSSCRRNPAHHDHVLKRFYNCRWTSSGSIVTRSRSNGLSAYSHSSRWYRYGRYFVVHSSSIYQSTSLILLPPCTRDWSRLKYRSKTV